MLESVLKTADLDQEGIYPIVSFKLHGKDKTAVLYNINNRMLNYVLLQEGEVVEFHFPAEPVYKSRDFLVSKEKNTVTFTNADAQYQIYQESQDDRFTKIGIRVKVGNKTYNIRGDVTTLKGSIEEIPIEGLDNVYRE